MPSVTSSSPWIHLLLCVMNVAVYDVTAGEVETMTTTNPSDEIALSGNVCQTLVEVAENVTQLVETRCSYLAYVKCGAKKGRRCTKLRFRKCNKLVTHVRYVNMTRDVCCDDWQVDDNNTCSLPICTPNCLNGGTCQDLNGSRGCVCTPGYSGYTCENVTCYPPCEDGGTCHVTNGDPRCLCPDGRFSHLCVPNVYPDISPPALVKSATTESAFESEERPGWVWPLVGLVILVIFIVIIIIVTCCLVRRRSHMMGSPGNGLSRITESFRKRIGKEGISNPVFVIDSGNHTAPSADCSMYQTELNHNQNELRNSNIINHDPGMSNKRALETGGLYNLAQGMPNRESGSSSQSSTMNYYVDHDPGTLNRGYTSIDDISPVLKTGGGSERDPQRHTQQATRKPLKVQLSEDYYEPIGEPISQSGPTNVTHTPKDSPKINIGKSRAQQAEPAREAPKLSKKRRKRKPQKHIYGNIDSSEMSPRTSDEVSSEGARSSGELYSKTKITPAQSIADDRHAALVEADDTYDFAPKLDSVYISQDEVAGKVVPEIRQIKRQLPDNVVEGQHEADIYEFDSGSSEAEDIYQTVDGDDLYDHPNIGTIVENPLFGVQDVYENDEELGVSGVSLGNDHIYETVA